MAKKIAPAKTKVVVVSDEVHALLGKWADEEGATQQAITNAAIKSFKKIVEATRRTNLSEEGIYNLGKTTVGVMIERFEE